MKNCVIYSVLLMLLASGIMLATDKSLQRWGITVNDCLSLIGGDEADSPVEVIVANEDSTSYAVSTWEYDGVPPVFVNNEGKNGTAAYCTLPIVGLRAAR